MENQTFTAPERRYLSTREVTAFLEQYAGLTYTMGTIYKMTMRKAIPFHKAPSGRLMFPIKEIIEWVDNGGIVEPSEKQEDAK